MKGPGGPSLREGTGTGSSGRRLYQPEDAGAHDDLLARAGVQLREKVLDMPLDGGFAHLHGATDLLVGEVASQQFKDFALLGREHHPSRHGRTRSLALTRRAGRWAWVAAAVAVPFGLFAYVLDDQVGIAVFEAVFATAEVVINASAVMGEVRVVVDPGTTVVVEGVGVMGEYSEARA